MGGSTLSGLIPSLKAWLVGFARDSLISMYVMPEHWTYRLDPVSLLLSPSSSWVLCLNVFYEFWSSNHDQHDLPALVSYVKMPLLRL